MALVAFMLILSAPNKTMAQEGGYISDQEFYDELQPYGTWVYDEQYGNVWIPDVDEDFRPYATRGYWAMTNYGNTWVSDYPWGWATFHYGRWHFDDYYGWEWVPGSEWAPAWVSWRNGGGYYGWAPMEPGVSIDMSFGDNYSVPDNYWVFAPYAYINNANIYNYYVPRTRVRTIISNTVWVRNRYTYNNHTYISGPRREDIQRYTHRPVQVYNINNVNRPSRITVNNNYINIYRPAVKHFSDARPARVIDGNAYRQQNPTQRIGNNDNHRGASYNAVNAAKLAAAARNTNPDRRVVRVNNDNDRRRPDNNNASYNRANPVTRPGVNGNPQQQQQAPNQLREQQFDQRRQQNQKTDQQRQQQQQSQGQHRQQQFDDQRRQQNQQTDQIRQQQQQQAQDQQRQQVRDQQRQQQQQAQEQQRQQAQQQRQQQQQEQQRQQVMQQRQQQQQAQDQQRQQAQQQRQQQQQEMQQQRQQQQQEQQRQQAQQQRQQQQQAQEQQRQQAQQQRQQQQQEMQQQRQQQQQAQEQQRQQAQQQRQQQQEQQRQQQQPAGQSHRPGRN